MNTRSLIYALTICLCLGVLSASADVPHYISFQGTLSDASGNPITGTLSIQFSLYTDLTVGTLLWTETQPSVSINNGFFDVQLGQLTALGEAVFNNPEVWLGIAVGGDPEMTPRTRIVSVGYSYRVGTVDGASGGTLSSDLMVQGRGNFGSGNTNTGTYAFVAGQDNIASGDYSAIGGGRSNTCSGGYSIVGGGVYNNASVNTSTVGGGNTNTANGESATVSGGVSNNASGYGATVGGGFVNNASEYSATVGGGGINTASAPFSTVSGGNANTASNDGSTVGGGGGNTASNWNSTVGGGFSNTANDSAATVSGGWNNLATGRYAIVGGGRYNRARGYLSVVAGGGGSVIVDSNSASGYCCTIGGGRRNTASISFATVGGGELNSASNAYATVGGGHSNKARGSYSVVAGGGGDQPSDSNSASGPWSTIGGGRGNTASGGNATVGGGWLNTASGGGATVPGGFYNTAQGYYSFAAGQRAKANHDGAFVWADGIGQDFISTASNQFLIRAGGGVGVGTNNPQAQLDVAGQIRSSSGGFRFPDGSLQTTAAGAGSSYWAVSGSNIYNSNSGNVGIGTTTPGYKLHIEGQAISGIGSSASGQYSTVGGGWTNSASDWYSTVSGGNHNTAGNVGSTVSGGNGNSASGYDGTVGGGVNNGASGGYATVGGGANNAASAGCAVVAGGCTVRAEGENSSVGGGSNNIAHGLGSTIPGGIDNLAEGDYTVAMGRQAKAGHDGSFVWADGSGQDFSTTANNQFLIRAQGGVGIGTANPQRPLDVAGNIRASGNMECVALNQVSDLRLKTDIQPICDALSKIELLQGVSFRWNQNAKSVGATPGDQQIGVIAQDVEQVFPELVSTTNNGYKSVDYTKLTAVLLEAIKELKAQNEKQQAEIENLKAERK